MSEINVPDITTTLIDPFDRADLFIHAVPKGSVMTDKGPNRRAQLSKSFSEKELLEGQVRALTDFYFKVYPGHIKKLRERLIKENKLSEKESKKAFTKETFVWEEDTDPLRRDLAIKEFMRRVKNYSLEAPYRPKGDIEEFVAFDENTYISQRRTEGEEILKDLKRRGLKPKGRRFITKEQYAKEITPEVTLIMGPELATYFPKRIIDPERTTMIPGKRIWRMKTSKDYEYEERGMADQLKEDRKERRKKQLIEWGKKEGVIPLGADLLPPPEEEQRDRAGGKTRVLLDYEEKVKGYMTKIQQRINKYINEVNQRIREKEKGKVKKMSAGIGGFQPGMKVDTSKVGAGMGKEFSITSETAQQLKKQFKGGAKTAWLSHVDKFRKENPELSYKEALKEAKKTYTPMRKKEREQQKVDTAKKKVEKGPKPRKLTKKQVALRFNSYSDSGYKDFQGYKPDFEKIWNEHIKGKRFKDNEELLKVFKEKFEGGGVEEKRKKAKELEEKKKAEEREKENIELRRKTFKEDYEGKIPSKFKFLPQREAMDIYARIKKYHEKKSGEKGHTEYLKAQRDYELLKEGESDTLKKKWKKLINEEKRKRKAMKSK